MIVLLEAVAALALHVTYAALHFHVTECLCSPSQRCHLMWGQDQDQDQAHSQPLDLSLQSSASMKLCLMELHKLEEKRSSSKIGKWDKLLTKRTSSEGIYETYSPNLEICYQAQHPPFFCVLRDGKVSWSTPKGKGNGLIQSLNNSIMWLMAAVTTHQGHWWLGEATCVQSLQDRRHQRHFGCKSRDIPHKMRWQLSCSSPCLYWGLLPNCSAMNSIS